MHRVAFVCCFHAVRQFIIPSDAYQHQVTRDGDYSRSNHARDAVSLLHVTLLGFGKLSCDEGKEKSSTAVEAGSG